MGDNKAWSDYFPVEIPRQEVCFICELKCGHTISVYFQSHCCTAECKMKRSYLLEIYYHPTTRILNCKYKCGHLLRVYLFVCSCKDNQSERHTLLLKGQTHKRLYSREYNIATNLTYRGGFVGLIRRRQRSK